MIMKKLNRNLNEEEDSIQWSKIVSQVAVNIRRRDWTDRRFETFCQEKRAIPSTMTTNLPEQVSLAFSLLFLKDGSYFEPDTVYSFQKTPTS